jgi:hypothetical protein
LGRIRLGKVHLTFSLSPGAGPGQALCLGVLVRAHESCRQIHPANQGEAHLRHSWGSKGVPSIRWMSVCESPTPSKLWVVFGSEISGGGAWGQRTKKDKLK